MNNHIKSFIKNEVIVEKEGYLILYTNKVLNQLVLNKLLIELNKNYDLVKICNNIKCIKRSYNE